MDETIPPVLPASNATKNAEHLRLLAIFHFIFAGLGVFIFAFLGLHYAIMSTVFNNPEMWKGKDGREGHPPPPELFAVFKWFYLFFALVILVGMVMNGLSGYFLLKRRNRLFSMIVAGIDCMQIPFGTTLGVFTLVVLNRDSVRADYESQMS